MPRRTSQSPLELQDPKIDSAAAADRGVPPPPMEGAAASTPQAHGSGRRSYLEAVKGGPKANQNPYESLRHLLFDYLIKFAIISEIYGKGPIITVSATGNWDLWIPQGHLSEYDQELSCAVFNSHHDRFKEFLYPAVSRLIHQRFVNNAVGGMNATFYTMPPSTKTLEDFVREQGPLVSMRSIFVGNVELCVARDIGMMLVHGFLVYIYSVHKKGRTWNGGFSTGDMVVVGNCMTCTINKISNQGEPHCRAADLQKIAEIFKPMFTINEEMALYFDELQKDLSKVNTFFLKGGKVNNGEVEAKWYKYLLSHPALKPSTARSSLESGLHHAVDNSKANGDPIPSVLREGSDWMAVIPPRNSEDKSCTDYCLRKVFWFNDKPNNEDFNPFARTVEALLRYKRNFLQHGQKHIKVQDHTELELFLAKTFPMALPNILWGLLSRNEMNGPFKGHWEQYCSFRVGNDCNAEGRTGIRISLFKDGRSGGKA